MRFASPRGAAPAAYHVLNVHFHATATLEKNGQAFYAIMGIALFIDDPNLGKGTK